MAQNNIPIGTPETPQFQQQTTHGTNNIEVHEKNQAVNLPGLLKPEYPLPQIENWSLRYVALFCFGVMVPSAIAAIPGRYSLLVTLVCFVGLVVLGAWAMLSPPNRAIAAAAFLIALIGAIVTILFVF